MDDVRLPFREGTVSWDVLRRPVFLLGGIRALLMQISEPRIAAGVAEHSDFTDRVFDRTRHTVELMVEVGLGDSTEAQRAVEEMQRAHRGVRGVMADGSIYDAADPHLRLWVLATLIDTVLVVEEAFVGEFREEERARYYQESVEVAKLLDVGDAPPNLDEFRSYVEQRCAELVITDQARQIAHHVLYPRFGRLPPWFSAPLRVITADLLPVRLRHGYGLSLSRRQDRSLRRFQTVSRAILPRMPNWIRTFPLLRPVGGVQNHIFNHLPTRNSAGDGPVAGLVNTRGRSAANPTEGIVDSVNVGERRRVEWAGRSVETAIWKQPVSTAVSVRGVNLEGDDQADRRVHGGYDKAVYAYASEDYRWWSNRLGTDLTPGTFGENLTVSGLDLRGALVGERWRVGSAVLEVSQPRLPCYKLGIRMSDPQFVDTFETAERFGVYLRIIEEGIVAAGDGIEIIARPDHGLTITDLGRSSPRPSREMIERILMVPEVPDSWREWAERARHRHRRVAN